MALTRRSALALLAVAGVTGCGFEPVTWTTPSGAPSATEVVDPATTLDPQFRTQSLEGSPKSIEEGFQVGQQISTPHFDGTLEALFIGERLGERTAAQVREQTEIKAAPGHELVAFTLRAGQPTFLDAEEPPTFALLVGDREAPIDPPFGEFNSEGRYSSQWVLHILSVPQQVPVLLQVSDQGRSVRVDLREAKPVEDDAWAVMEPFREPKTVTLDPPLGVFSRNIETVPPADPQRPVQKETSEFLLQMQPEPTALVPWIRERGWAPEGKLWLPLSTQAKVVFSPATPQFVITMDVAESLTYQGGDGVLVKAEFPETVTTLAMQRGQAALDVAWLVPETDTRAVIGFDPVGTMVVNYTGGITFPSQFVGEAAPLEFTVSVGEPEA